MEGEVWSFVIGYAKFWSFFEKCSGGLDGEGSGPLYTVWLMVLVY